MKKVLVLVLLAVAILFAGQAQAASGQKLTDEGASYLLDILLQDQALESFKLKIYCTDVSPADTSTYSSFTWCTGSVGEADKTLTRGASWTISGSAPTQAAFSQQTFTFTGDLTTNATIYGYCIVNNASDKTIGCEALTSSFTPHNGYTLSITPTIKMSKGTPD